jgi:hypothetical protein
LRFENTTNVFFHFGNDARVALERREEKAALLLECKIKARESLDAGAAGEAAPQP